MNAREIEEMSWRMAEVYEAVVNRILINMARHFQYINAGEIPSGTWLYQVKKLAEMGQVTRETEQIILNMLGDADGVLRALLEESIINGLKDAEPALRKAAEAGLLNGGNIPPALEAGQMQTFQAFYAQSADKLNLVNTVMLESTTWAYQATVADIVNRVNTAQGILNVATGEVVTGVSSWNDAIRRGVQNMVKNGITGFVDHGGHKWTPEAYVAMDVRTTMANTARAAVWERCDEYGDDMYQVSWHNAARPLCFDWQCKVISRTDTVREVEDDEGNAVHVYAQSETTYGQAAGLFGVNCGHYPIPFVPGFSRIRKAQQDAEENAKAYEESQQQRALERKLRDQKRDLEVMKAQGASEDELKAQRKRIKEASGDIDDFCAKTGRTRRRDRETAPVRATWPTEAGEVTRYNRGYISTTQTPPPKGPYVPPTPPTTPPVTPTAPPVVAPAQNVAQQATFATASSGIFKNVKGLDDTFRTGMGDALEKATVPEAKTLFKKYADELVCVNPTYTGGAKFNRFDGGVYMNAAKVASGTTADTPYETAFHEFGHMIDWLAGGKSPTYLSNQELDGKRLLDVIKSDFQTFKKSLNVSKASDVIPVLKAENMDTKTRGNISDILEKCTGKSYPLNVGHGAAYHKREGATEKEFFAEVLDSSIANEAAYEQMQRLFPNAVEMVWEMIRRNIQ